MSGNGKGTEVAIGAGVGVGVGTFLASHFAGKPVSAAPDNTKLDYIATLLEQILATLKLPGGAFPSSLLTPWVAKEPEQIFQLAIRSIGVFQSDIMVDLTHAKRLLIKLESSLDVAIAIQLVGNSDNTFLTGTNINGPLACPANANISVGIAWDDWHPYVGVRITTAAAPTLGFVTIWAVAQE